MINPEETIFLGAAKQLAARGLHVFPLLHNSKVPAIKGWQEQSTTDLDQIEQWAKKFPNANVGVDCAKSKIIAVDVDKKNGHDGYASLDAKLNDGYLTSTFSVNTASGGAHLYYNAASSFVHNKVGVLDGVDIRGIGGYVVGPGSVVDGNKYTIFADAVLADFPNELQKLISQPKTISNPINWEMTQNSGAAQGQRNNSVFRYGCRLRAKGIAFEEAAYLVALFAAHCTPPLPESEAMACLASAWKYTSTYSLTDIGNSKRLIVLGEGDIRYCPEQRVWLVWTGSRWIPDMCGSITELAKSIVDLITVEAGNCNHE